MGVPTSVRQWVTARHKIERATERAGEYILVMSKTLAEEIRRLRHDAKSMAAMAELLGYTNPWGQLQFDNRAYASNLIDFLDDNPGACQALIEWVIKEGFTRDGEKPQSISLDDDEDEDDEDA